MSAQFEIGLTLLPARGFYSGEEKTALYAVVNQFQIPRLKSMVYAIDPNAYMTVTTVSDLLHGSRESAR